MGVTGWNTVHSCLVFSLSIFIYWIACDLFHRLGAGGGLARWGGGGVITVGRLFYLYSRIQLLTHGRIHDFLSLMLAELYICVFKQISEELDLNQVAEMFCGRCSVNRIMVDA